MLPKNATAPADTPSVCTTNCGYEYGDRTKAATHIELLSADPDLIPPSFVTFCDPSQTPCEVTCSGGGQGAQANEDDDLEVNRCTIKFRPMTAGTKTISFKVTANGVKQVEAGTIEINSRDMAFVTANPVFGGNFAENKSLQPITAATPILEPGVHYNYTPGETDPAAYANISYMQVRQLDGVVLSSYMDCDGTSCPFTTDEVALGQPAHKFDCGTAASLADGHCRLPQFMIDQTFFRSQNSTDPALWEKQEWNLGLLWLILKRQQEIRLASLTGNI